VLHFIKQKKSIYKSSIFKSWVLGAVLFLAEPGFCAELIKSAVPVARFDDWTLRCVSKTACEITQPLMVNQDGKPVEILNLAVSPAQDKAKKASWAMVVLTPLDVQLTSDFGFAAGDAKPELFRYRNCNHLGCFVVIPLNDGRLSAIKKSNAGAVFFRLLNGQAVKLSFSFKGFGTALDALKAKNEARK
jgi:invasion protein IalB